MNKDILFKLYYLKWHEQKNVEVSYKKQSDKKEINNFKKISLSIEDMRNYTKDIKDISNIKKYFKSTMYLDIWVELCSFDKDYFKPISISTVNKNIENIVNTIHYIEGSNLEDFLRYNEEDFLPIYSEEDFSIIGNEVGENLKIKNCLLILRKIDLEFYNYFNLIIQKNLEKKIKNSDFVKRLWNTINIKEDGEVELTNTSLNDLKNLFLEYPNLKQECFDEVDSYYKYLKLSNSKNIEFVRDLIFE